MFFKLIVATIALHSGYAEVSTMRIAGRAGYRRSGKARGARRSRPSRRSDSFLEKLKRIEEQFLATAFFAVKIVTILVVFVAALMLEGGMVWHIKTIEFGPASSHPQMIEPAEDGAQIIRL